MEYLFIYLLQMASALENATIISLVMLIVTSVFLFFALIFKIGEEGSSYSKQCEIDFANKLFNKSIKVTVISLVIFILCSLVPTKQTLLLMGGTYLGKKAINSVMDSGKFEKINTIIDLQLDKYIAELKEGNK